MPPDPAEAVKDPRFTAAIDLLRRSGAREVQIRYEDDNVPVMWGVDVLIGDSARELAGGLDPLTAAFRLCEILVDGGHCLSCRRPTGVSDDWEGNMPLDELICWYVYDPELQKYRRGCEGDHEHVQGKIVGRNDPCPCGSGQKFKRCHGAG